MQDRTSLFDNSGEHVATIGFNELPGPSANRGRQCEAMELFCPSKEMHPLRATANSTPRPGAQDPLRPELAAAELGSVLQAGRNFSWRHESDLWLGCRRMNRC